MSTTKLTATHEICEASTRFSSIQLRDYSSLDQAVNDAIYLIEF